MKILDDPFDYPEEFKAPKTPEQIEDLREKRRAYRAKRLGRPIGKHGGARKGAGRKKLRPWTHKLQVVLNRVQIKLLEDLGNGDIHKAAQILIERYTE